MPSVSKRPNPLRIDPTRTATLRRKFEVELIARFERLKTKLRKYLLADDKLELKALVGNELSNNGWVTIKGHHVLLGSPTSSKGSKGDTEKKAISDKAAKQAVEDYTTDKFQEINKGLRDGTLEDSQIVSEIDHYLKTAPKRPGVTVRSFHTSDSNAQEIEAMLSSGTFSDAAYAIARKSPTTTDKIAFQQKLTAKNQVVLKVTGQSGVDISHVSLNANEGEVLYPRNTKFRVDKWVKTPAGGYLAEITEIVPTANARFKFNARPERIEEFRKWLATQVEDEILGDPNTNETAWWDRFIAEGYRQGAGRAFDDTMKPYARGYAKTGGVSDFYKGTKYQFLQSSFAQPETVEKVQLLASRVFTELKGVTDAMSQKMTRDLTEGLARGENPYTIAKQLASGVDSVGEVRARAIARTEIVRAHNEGQLDALENMGVEEVGVMVEWSTAMNACKLCQPMEGVVFTLKEAKGMLPRHTNCRCSYLPANVGENQKGQVRGKVAIEKAIDKSIAAELPKTIERTLAEQKKRTSWAGADASMSKQRPKPVVSPQKK